MQSPRDDASSTVESPRDAASFTDGNIQPSTSIPMSAEMAHADAPDSLGADLTEFFLNLCVFFHISEDFCKHQRTVYCSYRTGFGVSCCGGTILVQLSNNPSRFAAQHSTHCRVFHLSQTFISRHSDVVSRKRDMLRSARELKTDAYECAASWESEEMRAIVAEVG
ncbi:unnamed protein product [Gongylonema pulchrum]|uniref:Uncharacterized protein n=1 Tax=Gongylonema pulchrum TaxID=637853 RepID=A0A3P7Q222_9BILA|nr:unnamed protein product [Gongylonema pulchrum]